MIVIVAKSQVKPECVEAFKETAKPLVEGSRAEEGNIFYDLYEDGNDPCALVFIEKWRDEAAIKAHNASDHFTKTVPKLAPLRVGAAEIRHYRQL
ncbi:MAG: antibiotic biosynthesis monooxygenase [Clostridiales Family XIII bacterium]|jgi:quinol monooxygenase YgiN|nr:antibiotic biosynthesis monooxygenase [Clostridiales Family XIII bacterium]